MIECHFYILNKHRGYLWGSGFGFNEQKIMGKECRIKCKIIRE